MDPTQLATWAVVLALAGVGYGAWRWLLRRLRHCEDALEACRERHPPEEDRP